jgi:hypothetical protein
MPSTLTPLLDAAAIREEVLQRISELEPRLDELARHQLARLTPDRWTIEWHLPSWLGRRFDLDPPFVAALVRGNVLGMLAIRLEDDLEDGEVSADEVGGTRALARLAYELAVAEHRAWFERRSPVWALLERSMVDWRAGADGPDLAARGAPLKIAGYACCLQAGRLDAWPTLERSLDRAITALVLYDQFFDWEADIAAGRWNAFVARIGDGAPEPARRDSARAAVLTAMLTRGVVREHFDAAVSEANEAAALADDLEITELVTFLRTWAARTSDQGTRIAGHYGTAADQATRLLLGTTIGGATG